MEEQLTLKQAAQALRVSLTHVRGLVRRGELPALRIGKRVLRIAPHDMREYLATHRARPRNMSACNTGGGVAV